MTFAPSSTKLGAAPGHRSGERDRAFHDKLPGLTFFDPACGCGNFLIITYRELRRLEIEVLRESMHPKGQQAILDVAPLSKIDVDQFYGIEIEESFPRASPKSRCG